MRKFLIVPVLCAFIFTSCSSDSDAVSPELETIEDAVTTKAKVKASGYESDPNFLTLVEVYADVAEKTWLNVKTVEEPPRELTVKKTLQLASFPDLEAFRSFQLENLENYFQLVKDYRLNTEEQRFELSNAIVEKSMAVLEARSGRTASCVGELVGCLLDALNAFNNFITTYGGVGCDWNPGSDCWDNMVSYEAFTIRRIGGCINDYFGC